MEDLKTLFRNHFGKYFVEEATQGYGKIAFGKHISDKTASLLQFGLGIRDLILLRLPDEKYNGLADGNRFVDYKAVDRYLNSHPAQTREDVIADIATKLADIPELRPERIRHEIDKRFAIRNQSLLTVRKNLPEHTYDIVPTPHAAEGELSIVLLCKDAATAKITQTLLDSWGDTKALIGSMKDKTHFNAMNEETVPSQATAIMVDIYNPALLSALENRKKLTQLRAAIEGKEPQSRLQQAISGLLQLRSDAIVSKHTAI